MKYNTQIVVLDFGAQYSQLIARRIREMNIYCEIWPYTTSLEHIQSAGLKGIILSGGPSSVYDAGAPRVDPALFDIDVPILGICYGMQLISFLLGGTVLQGSHREYGNTAINIKHSRPLFSGLPSTIPVWMSHGDRLETTPNGFTVLASSGNTPLAAMGNHAKKIYGVQFHPEVTHTPNGQHILKNFVTEICQCTANWRMEDFVSDSIETIRKQAQGRTVVCGVSGGVDSTVLAKLLTEALGDAVSCIYVDNGVMRLHETDEVRRNFERIGVEVTYINAADGFLRRLNGIRDPEKKRRRIGKHFVNVFFSAVKNFDMLAQGTLYPDVIESISVKGPSKTIKTHHNRVPQIMKLIEQGRVIEPLKELFKDEVRQIGRVLKIPEEILMRWPFPGPGLAIRIIGAVTPARLYILRRADAIVREELLAGAPDEIWQAFAVLLPVKSVGVMGDERTYENVITVRAVSSIDGMTADWSKISHDVLGRISNRIINEVNGVNRVVYDISSKPPATIEWE